MARAKDKAAPNFSKLKEHSPARVPAHNSSQQKDKDKPDIDIEPEI